MIEKNIFEKIICFERFANEGCDLLCVDKDNNVWLIEIKACTISYSDASKAIKQLEFSEKWIKTNKAELVDNDFQRLRKIIKIFLHDDSKGNCKFSSQAANLFKYKRIKRIKATKSPSIRILLSYYRQQCK